MFVGGLRALVLQSLHPLAMAGVAAHSGYRGDPWGRLQRTSQYLAVTTYGPDADAERAIRRITWTPVRGRAPDGRPYRAADPHLLEWVHITEIDSFLLAHRGSAPAGCPPSRPTTTSPRPAWWRRASVSSIHRRPSPRCMRRLRAFRRARRHARSPRHHAVPAVHATLPLLARPAYGLIATAAIATLPSWARLMLHLPPAIPVADDVIGELAGQLATRAFRWTLAEPA